MELAFMIPNSLTTNSELRLQNNSQRRKKKKGEVTHPLTRSFTCDIHVPFMHLATVAGM